MGYHLTVLKTEQGKPVPVSRNQVEGLIESRNDLAFKPDDAGCLLITKPAFGDASPLLVWQNGEIWTDNADRNTLDLLLGIAEKLNARVRGDELETYATCDETYIHQDDKAQYDRITRSRKHLKIKHICQKIVLRIAVVAFFIFLILTGKLLFDL